MGVDHGGLQAGVTQHFLQRQNIPAVHHEMACERVAQDVGELTRQQFNPRFLDGHTKRANRAFEYPA